MCNYYIYYNITNLITNKRLFHLGQLADLLHILDTAGMPSVTNKYIFNGDFVDRGSQGVEVVTAILMLYLAVPGQLLITKPH